MKQVLVVIGTILASLSSALANLGDDDERIEDTYGKLVERHTLDDGTVSLLYHKDRYLCLVVFDKRRSVSETYCRVDGKELSQKEISRFLKANAGRGVTWTGAEDRRARSVEHGARFERSDDKAVARYGDLKGKPALTVKLKANAQRPTLD